MHHMSASTRVWLAPDKPPRKGLEKQSVQHLVTHFFEVCLQRLGTSKLGWCAEPALAVIEIGVQE